MESLAHRPFLVAFALLLIAAEFIMRKSLTRKGYDLKEAAASLGIALGDIVTRSLSGGVILSVYLAANAYAPFALPFDDWRIWALGFFLVEFSYYWMHRLSHTVRWLWATHAVHHSAHELVLPSALRLGWTGLISGGWLMFIPLVLVGFSPTMIAALLALNLAYQFILHTEFIGTLGPLEWLFNTPSHHRVHHASNAQYLDKNFGGVLIIYDRLFGTFAAQRADIPLRYGLVHDLQSKNPIIVAFHEWARMARAMASSGSLRGAIAVALGRP